MCRRLCRLRDVPEAGGKGFVRGTPPAQREIFVIRRGSEVYAYINSCPHTGVNLDWNPDQFLSADGQFIQCATHDARFRIEDGYCIAGPCAGRALTPVSVAVEDGDILCDPMKGPP